MSICRALMSLTLACAGPALAQAEGPTRADIAPVASVAGPAGDAFPGNVAQCWNLGALPRDAQGVVLTVAVDLAQDGRPLADTVRLIAAGGASAAATEQAYQAARRAILRCAGAAGSFPPPGTPSVEITFDPSGMSDR